MRVSVVGGHRPGAAKSATVGLGLEATLSPTVLQSQMGSTTARSSEPPSAFGAGRRASIAKRAANV
jgi:hypothetical protein